MVAVKLIRRCRYNWSFILLSSGKLLKGSWFSTIKRWLGLLLIGLAVTGTLFHSLSRPGLYISLLLVTLIAVCDWIVTRVRKKYTVDMDKEASKGNLLLEI